MPKTMRTISCCYCDASTMIDLAKIGRGVLTCDACGARLSSARMEALVNKPIPVRHTAPKTCGSLDPRWFRASGPVVANMTKPKKKSVPKPTKKSSHKRKKRKSFLDRLEDIWDEIEDIWD